MTCASSGAFSRPVLVARLPAAGLAVEVVANPAECAALAGQFGLPAITSLVGTYRLVSRHEGVHLSGRVVADVVQVCVVSLDEFESRLGEDVELDFTYTPQGREPVADDETVIELDRDEPEEIVDGRVDLGLVTAEFLALGLDPYPRKPGISFEQTEPEEMSSPFAGLAVLKPPHE